MGDNGREQKLRQAFNDDGWDGSNWKKISYTEEPEQERIGIVVEHKTAVICEGSSDFSVYAFTGTYTIEGLCHALETSDLKINTLEELNGLLNRSELYEIITRTHQDPELSDSLKQLKDTYDRSGRQSDLNKLNRSLLEEFFPNECPRGKCFKKAYYLEGSPYAMGYLMGRLAEPAIAEICTSAIRPILSEFIGDRIDKTLMLDIVEKLAGSSSASFFTNVPEQYKQYKKELEGMYRGCKDTNGDTRVTLEALWLLNVGFDAIVAHAYKQTYLVDIIKELLKIPLDKIKGLLKIPLLCNGFSVFGTDENPFHFMGRDFMFPMGGILPKYVSMIICHPSEGQRFVSVTVPGIIGSFAGMNIKGMGIGANMSPAGIANSDQPGVNSILLSRHTIQNSSTLDDAIEIINEAPRGVPWNYIIADGSTNAHRACVIEAVKKFKTVSDFETFLKDYSLDDGHENVSQAMPGNVWAKLTNQGLFPHQDGVDIRLQTQTPSTEYKNGLMVRKQDYPSNADVLSFYQTFNERLVADFTTAVWSAESGVIEDNIYGYHNMMYSYKYRDDDWSSTGFVNKTYEHNNCPMTHYFAPLRNDSEDEEYLKGKLVVASNFFMIPEMRLCQMDSHTSILVQNLWDEMQWRYDKLSELLRMAYKDMTKMGSDEAYQKAQDIINFLSPLGCKHYYWINKKNKGKYPKEIEVNGSVSIMDLKKKKRIRSLYGNYGDEWVQVTLGNYFKSDTN